MKRYELVDSEQPNEDLAEETVAFVYDGWSRFGVQDFDVSNGSQLGEVKSTATKIGYNTSEKGRFRLFKSQHDRLVRYNRRKSGWYFFVLYDVSSRPVVAYLKRKDPAAIGRRIGARGGWTGGGHRAGKEYKLPYDVVFPEL